MKRRPVLLQAEWPLEPGAPSGLSGLISHLVDTGSRPPCDPPTLGGTLGHLSMRLPLCYALTSASSASCS